MKEMLSTKEVAQFLNVNEKMVYSLIADKGLPASKVTGKWLFPKNLVVQWVEAATQNYPRLPSLPEYHGLVLIAGSNDLLLDKLMATFNLKHENQVAMFGVTGSMGGLNALNKNRCHIAASHLASDDREYNFPFIGDDAGLMPAVMNLCHREQGILLARGNPANITAVSDLAAPGVTVVNRQLGCGTRQLFDQELIKAGIKGSSLDGYDHCLTRHMAVGLALLNGKAHAGPGIRAVANVLGLDFLPLCWERFDLVISKDRFFDQGVQSFLALLKGKVIRQSAEEYGGYDLSMTGKMIYPEAREAPEDSDA